MKSALTNQVNAVVFLNPHAVVFDNYEIRKLNFSSNAH
jgi:hypothetical protein